MDRARRKERLLAGLALGLLALTAELAGRSLTHRIDVGRHVGRVSYSGADYYPFLLAAVKIGIALMSARVAWRFAKAHATVRAARRVTGALGRHPARRVVRVRIELSPKLWLLSFVGTASIYLLQADSEWAARGNWSLLGPWLHSSALPVFAVLSVLVAVLFKAVECWLSEVESIAADALALVRRLTAVAPPSARPHVSDTRAPRRLFGRSFGSRPPPVPA